MENAVSRQFNLLKMKPKKIAADLLAAVRIVRRGQSKMELVAVPGADLIVYKGSDGLPWIKFRVNIPVSVLLVHLSNQKEEE